MDSQSSSKSSSNRRTGSKRTGGNKDHHKEHRLSKASIGQPMKLDGNGKLNDMVDRGEVTGGPSMVMKCVIVQRDEKGYGLTVSGDNPVYVQSVKEDGAAARAGVLQGDRIIKVNGQKVTDCNHMEVVKLVKADSYVALTLLGLPPSQAPTSDSSTNVTTATSNDFITAPAVAKQQSFYEQKVEMIKKMLEQERSEVERIKEEYAKNPEQKILLELGTAQKLKQDLEKQLWKIESMKNQNQQQPQNTASQAPLSTDIDERTGSEISVGQLIDMDEARSEITTNRSGDDLAQKTSSESGRVRRSRTLNDSSGQDEVRSPGLAGGADHGSTMGFMNEHDSTNPFLNDDPIVEVDNAPRVMQQNKEIINFEEDDIAAQCNTFQDHGPFNDLDKLRQRPAYLAVFLNYLICSHEPANFLLSFTVDNYRQLSSSKEMTKQAEGIFKTYLAPNAPLKVSVDEGIVKSIQGVVSAKNMPEETLKGVFDPAVQVSNKEIRNQLSKYREKRELGLGNLIGDEKLPPVDQLMDSQQELRLVDEVLSPTLNELMQSSASDESEQIRLNHVTDALHAFLTQYGTKRKSKITSRMYSILRPSKPPPNSLSKGKISGSMESILDDTKDKRSSVIMTILGGSKKKNNPNSVASRDRKESRRDKPRAQTIWENSSSMIKPTKVSASVSVDNIKSQSTFFNDCEDTTPLPPKIEDKCVLMDDTLPPDLQAVTIHPAPQIHEPMIVDSELSSSYPIKNIQEEEHDPTHDNDTLQIDNAKKQRSRSGSFRHREDEKRHSGPPKSYSDPDKNKVEQAVVQHKTSHDHTDQSSRHSLLSTSDSIQSLAIDERSPIDLSVLIGDAEINVDSSEQHWSETVPRDTIRLIDRKEIKRQEVINELIYTEQHHVRDLRILEKVFYEPIQSENLLSKEELVQAFPNLAEILKLHRDLNKDLQEAKERDGHVVKNIGDLLLERFTGEAGNDFKNECAIYCGNQSTVLSLIKEKSKKDQKFNQYIQDAQRYQICRKLHLKDFIPMEFQRLTKYPLLLDNIIKNTNKKKQEKECEKLRKACEKCREILSFVNQTVKEAEDKQKIKEIQQNLDKTPLLKSNVQIVKTYKGIDLTEHPIVHHGLLTWRIGQMDKRKELALHCILYDEVMVLLHKQDDKYVLKCHGQSASSSGGTHAPFIAMAKVIIVRNVATDKRAFFVMSSSDVGPQMYEFVASSANAKKQWIQFITDTSKKDTIVATPSYHHRREAFLVPGSSHSENNYDKKSSEAKTLAGDVVGRMDDEQAQFDVSEALPVIPNMSSVVDPMHVIWSDLQSKEEEIRTALSEKYKLLAQMSQIDVEDLESILEMSSADDDAEPKTIVMHSLLCVDKLTGLLNDCATPESTFVKSRSDSDMVPTPSNRLSVEILEAGYHSDNGAASPPERWAEPVSHPDQSENDERSSLQHELSSSATLNSMSDIPFSEATSDGESSPTQQHHQVVIDAKQSYETRDQVMSDVAKREDGDMKVRMRNKDDFFFDSSKMLSVPDDNVSSSSKSRPLSGVELLTRVDVVPIKKLMEIAINLQTQLTKLMHVTNQNETDRNKLAEENQQLRGELEKLEREGGSVSHLPSYAEVLQDPGFDASVMSSTTNNIGTMQQDIEAVRENLKNSPERIFSCDEISSTPVLPRKTRRSTGF